VVIARRRFFSRHHLHDYEASGVIGFLVAASFLSRIGFAFDVEEKELFDSPAEKLLVESRSPCKKTR
jgi:hypothetical protein